MGLGLSTLLPTPYGWTSVYDLDANTILIDELGYPCRIKSLSQPYETDVYELQAGWGKRSIPEERVIVASANQELMSFTYKRFERMARLQDEAKTLYLEKLPTMPDNWPVWKSDDVPRATKQGRPAKPRAEAITMEKISETVKYQRKVKDNRWYLNHTVPIMFPMQLKKRDYTIPPYLLGLLINYTNGTTVKLTNESFNYYEQKFAHYGYSLIHPDGGEGRRHPYKLIQAQIPSLHLAMKEIGFSGNHIPAEYLRGSIQQRMELLQGLLDQYDQRFTEKDLLEISYKAKSMTLALQVAELVRSLGYPAFIKGGTVRYHAVVWHMAVNPYLMPKLKVRYDIMTYRAGNTLERYVWKIYRSEPSGKAPVRDIAVESPHGLFAVSELFLPMKSDYGNSTE